MTATVQELSSGTLISIENSPGSLRQVRVSADQPIVSEHVALASGEDAYVTTFTVEEVESKRGSSEDR